MRAADDAGSRDDFDAMVEEMRRALEEFVTGDATPVKRLYSRRDDITLANPFGPPRRGWAEVEDALDRAVANFRDGRVLAYEEVSRHATPDLGYVVQIERAEAKLGGRDDPSRISLRVTMIFRREDEGWKMLHRHADPITTPQAVESLIEN